MTLTYNDFALALLDDVLGARSFEQVEAEQQARRNTALGLPPQMGQTIQTRGCSQCGSTMYKIIETDSHGNPTGSSLFICNNCGHQEG